MAATDQGGIAGNTDPTNAPEVTKPQAWAIGQAFVAILLVFGFDVGESDRELILAVSGALAAVIPLSDAAIRRKRSDNAEAIAAARAERDRGDLERLRLENERRRLELELVRAQTRLDRQRRASRPSP